MDQSQGHTLPSQRGDARLTKGETRAVQEMFDRIAPRYDLLNHLLSIGHDVLWRQMALAAAELDPGATLLDVACGTGDFCLEALRAADGVVATGVDCSRAMLERARCKAEALQVAPRLHLLRGDALALPLPPATFDLCVSGFAMRNLADIPAAITQMVRVVRPGGRVVILEIGHPQSAIVRGVFEGYFSTIVPVVGGALSEAEAYAYLPRSLARLPTPQGFATVLTAAGCRRTMALRPTGGVAQIVIGEVGSG